MDDDIQVFAENERLREAVRLHFEKQFVEYAMDMVYKGEDTTAMAHAKKIIDNVFNKMKLTIKERPARRVNSSE